MILKHYSDRRLHSTGAKPGTPSPFTKGKEEAEE